MSQSKGKFIVFEGLDGSGLSTHSSLLRDWLKNQGYRVHLSAEPTDGPIGVLIRQILKDFTKIPKRPDILALLFAADRLYHVGHESYGAGKREQEGLLNAMREGYVVISNRYILSSLAYQTIPYGGVEPSIEWVKEINKFHQNNGTPIPNLTIFLDVQPSDCITRIASERDRYELFENYADLEAVYRKFKELIAEQIFNAVSIKEVEGNRVRSISKVQDEIRSHVKTLLEGNKLQQSLINEAKPHRKKKSVMPGQHLLGVGTLEARITEEDEGIRNAR